MTGNGNVVIRPRIRAWKRHARTSKKGRGMSDGHAVSAGQCSENHRKASSRRPTVISDPVSNARSFFPSLRTREETVESGTPSISPYRRAMRSSSSMADMGAISVNVPVLSTVNLPNAREADSGHSTGMDLKVLIANIDRLVKAQRTTDNAVGIRAGKQDAIRNLRRYASGDLKGMWTLDTLEAVAKALGTSSWELLRPPGAVAADEDLEDRINRVLDQRLGPAEPVRKRKNR